MSPVRVSPTHHSVTTATTSLQPQCHHSHSVTRHTAAASPQRHNVKAAGKEKGQQEDINPESVPRTDPRPCGAPKRVVAHFLKVPSVLPLPGSEFTKPRTMGSHSGNGICYHPDPEPCYPLVLWSHQGEADTKIASTSGDQEG